MAPATTRAMVSLAEERRELENSREKMREDARAEIEQWRDEAMQQARNEVAETRRTWQDNLEREQNDFVRRLKAVLGRQVFRAAAKAMEDLVDEGLEGKLVETFAGKLPTLIAENEETGRRMGDELEIKSGFELNEQQHKDVRAVVGELFPEADVDFAVEPDIGFTIRLVGGNLRIEWGLNRYMDEMEEKVLNTMHLAQVKK
jgi:vacuolar-type H+-ATPase subunit E/Vma4